MQHRKHRAFARCFHIFIIFFTAKSFKNSFFKKQFFPATGDIFEMQPVDFMNGCDSNAEAWVLHSCCYLAHLTSLSHLGKEKPEEANARLWRASASSGIAAPLGCVVLLFVCQHCAPLALFVALTGYQSLSPTNNAVFRKERWRIARVPILK